MSGQPRVYSTEEDRTTRVPQFKGVYKGIQIELQKGDQMQLINNETEFLQKCTRNERIDIGTDPAHYVGLAALLNGDKLWVQRLSKNAAMAALVLINSASASVSSIVGAEDFKTVDYSASHQLITLKFGGISTVVNLDEKYDSIDALIQEINNEITKSRLTGQVVAAAEGNKIKFSATQAYAGSKPLTITYGKSGSTFGKDLGFSNGQTNTGAPNGAISLPDALLDPSSFEFGQEDLALIYGKNGGDWTNDYQIKVVTDQARINLPGAFILEVYHKANLNTPMETHVVSRNPNIRNGYGYSVYIDDVLTSSNVIRGKNNTLVADSVLPVSTGSYPTALSGGNNGDAITTADAVTGLEKFANTNELPLFLFCDGGRADPVYQREIARMCESRADTTFFLSFPYTVENHSNYLEEMIRYRREILNLDSSFGGIYAGWLKVFDKYNNRMVNVPPIGHVMSIVDENAATKQAWVAPAGWSNGMLRVEGVSRKFSDPELGILYDNGINPIRYKVGKGIAPWGQKTLQYRESYTQRLNVRLMLNTIRPAIAEALEDYLFKGNTSETRSEVESMIKSYLDLVVGTQGIYKYRVVCSKENNSNADIGRNIMNVWVYVAPVTAVEYIPFKTIITDNGASELELAA